MAKIVINRERRTAQYFIEDLGDGIGLEMVLIPGGSFLMGSPEDELGRYKDESPQYSVTIQPFCLGKYPVTQAQWKAVASLPQVNRELNPDPSNFKGANRPVEQVSWYDAVEFCNRLSQKTGRQYRLPSEAEWEYACRAGTRTPFHFGETITPELANYNGEQTYGAGAKGSNRKETTPVGSFDVANAFGLYDMHGNVREWCADSWSDNSKGAPTDSSAWLDDDDNDKKNQKHVLRGGSWEVDPRLCRSACRFDDVGGYGYDDISFRVGCAAKLETSQDVVETLPWMAEKVSSTPFAQSPVTSYSQKELDIDRNETSSTASPIDFSDIVARTNVELKRLGWTNQQGRDYLVQTYGKRSRQLLTDAELLDYLHYLESEPSPQDTDTNATSSKASPIDFSDLIARTNVELKRLGWTNQQGRDYLVQTYGKQSRQLLTDAELLDYLHYLESEPSPQQN
jgi:formylglycine-generating enzyme required for sulfatase activity